MTESNLPAPEPVADLSKSPLPTANASASRPMRDLTLPMPARVSSAGVSTSVCMPRSREL